MNINVTMARNTNRNNIKPMLRLIVGVMILFCLCGTIIALQSINSGQFASLYSITHCTFSFFSIGILQVVMFMGSNLNSYALFALFILFLIGFELFTFLLITFLSSFAVFCLLVFFAIFQPANFAIISIAVFIIGLLVKFRKKFCFFANSASFRYDLLSHFRLLNRRLWLEPIARYALAVGSSYYIEDWGDFK